MDSFPKEVHAARPTLGSAALYDSVADTLRHCAPTQRVTGPNTASVSSRLMVRGVRTISLSPQEASQHAHDAIALIGTFGAGGDSLCRLNGGAIVHGFDLAPHAVVVVVQKHPIVPDV